jgi:hypothetical protein
VIKIRPDQYDALQRAAAMRFALELAERIATDRPELLIAQHQVSFRETVIKLVFQARSIGLNSASEVASLVERSLEGEGDIEELALRNRRPVL